SWLLDITTELEIPCIAAVSVNADGCGLACGLAARSTPQEAVQAAILEMCQMELAILVVELKLRERGEDGLNDVDRRHLVRSRAINAEHSALLQPGGVPRSPQWWAGKAQDRTLASLVRRLSAHGIDAYFVDLTVPSLGLAVVRAVAP